MILAVAWLFHSQVIVAQTQNYDVLLPVPASHGYTYTEEMVPGGGGFKLLTRIYLPEGEGPWPVVVTRTP